MKLTDTERRRGRLSKPRLARAVQHLKEAGYVILERALPDAWVNGMRKACDEALTRYLEDGTHRQRYLEDNKGHVGMYPPRTMPYMDPLAVENPLAVQIMEAAMGPDIFCTFYNTNTAWPGCGVQKIHRDTHHLFPEVPMALPVHMVVVNIPLVDFTVENGATEIWPGSHLVVDAEEDRGLPLEARAARMPSLRTVMPAGSLVVRDMRLWHRGMPNRTDTIRTMLAIVYFRAFLHRPDTMTIPSATWEAMSETARRLFRHNTVKARVGKAER
jgi:ectoine hydroxylase-related dioxygenase (phytanoyl-CoA dioxygenase family)